MSQANDRQIYVTRDVMSIAYGKLELLWFDQRFGSVLLDVEYVS
jgi:hypothetical protein